MSKFLLIFAALCLITTITSAKLSFDGESGGGSINKTNFLEQAQNREKAKKATPKKTTTDNATPTQLEDPEWVTNGNAIFKDVPAEIILNKKYVFVIPPLSDHISNDAYNDTLKKIAAEGYIVISNPLDSKSDYNDTIEKLKSNVGFLLSGNVQPKNIAIVGIREGGAVALRLSSQLNQADINFILVSAIPKKNPEKMMPGDDAIITGKIYNVYDREDLNNGSCKVFFKNYKGARFIRDVRLRTGKGEKMATEALDAWIPPALLWLGK